MKNKFAFWENILRGKNSFASRRVLTLLALIMCAAIAERAFALPGFTPYIADRSGEYVYYRDYTFNRESYIGFLAYDDSTYAIRYYAPADYENEFLDINILLYFSVDPSLPYLKMTGERIASAITPEQTDIVNYLHDLLYDFNSRRIKAGDVSPNSADLFSKKSYRDAGLSLAQDYPQFGGEVRILFDYLVPLFNIKKIISNDNKVLLEVVMFGMLQSSNDTSFSSFSGISSDNTNSSRNWKANTALAKKEASTSDGQKISLDEGWSSPMESLWLLGDEAIISMSHTEANVHQLLRMTLQNATWQNLSLTKNDDSYTVSSIYYQPDTKAAMYSSRVITNRQDTFAVFLLTVFNEVYDKNRSYFDAIVKSYKAK